MNRSFIITRIISIVLLGYYLDSRFVSLVLERGKVLHDDGREVIR